MVDLKKYFAMMVDVANKLCLVVGGGNVAERKTAALLEAGAQVRVVSPSFTDRLIQWADERKIGLAEREYVSSDLDEGVFLVMAATNSHEVNAVVRKDAESRGLFVSVANAWEGEESGNFIAPAVVRRGPLQIAVSTSGASPLLAKKMKRELEMQYGEEYAQVVEALGAARRTLRSEIADDRKRRDLLRRLLEEEDLPTLARRGQLATWITGWIQAHLDEER